VKKLRTIENLKYFVNIQYNMSNPNAEWVPVNGKADMYYTKNKYLPVTTGYEVIGEKTTTRNGCTTKIIRKIDVGGQYPDDLDDIMNSLANMGLGGGRKSKKNKSKKSRKSKKARKSRKSRKSKSHKK
jgi:hypothetical protein